MQKKLLIIAVCCIALFGCKNGDKRVLTSATGSIYELLVVVDNQYWNCAAGDTLRELLEAPTPCLPQVESYFTVSQAQLSAFDNLLMPTRNILIIDVDPTKYTQTKIGYSTDHWSHPQAVVRVCCADKEAFAECVAQYGIKIRNYFVAEELRRQADFYKTYCNHDASREIKQKFGIDILIPNDMVKIKETPDFYWVCDARGQVRKDIVVYSYPYTDPNTFTLDYLLHKRDSVLGSHVEGGTEGSHMTTERNHIVPELNEIFVNDKGYCAEVRGLWKMAGGISMGGPFVSHSRVDEINHRVITTECFIYGAGVKKRNPLRQMEAVLYTVKLPQEQNALPTLEVKPE